MQHYPTLIDQNRNLQLDPKVTKKISIKEDLYILIKTMDRILLLKTFNFIVKDLYYLLKEMDKQKISKQKKENI